MIFALVVALVFQSIFSWAQPLMNGVDAVLTHLADGVRGSAWPGPFASFLADGVIAGVGSVLVFLPQILIVFAFIAVLENTGYLARAALVMDKPMRKMGLQGKSFLPLISSYACAIPGIMATRTIESKRDRLATIFVAPFMTCSARLPVYALLISAFVPDRPIFGRFFGWQAFTLLGLYAAGFFAALLTAWLLKSSLLRADPLPFILEIPPYRWPQWKNVWLLLWDRANAFLRQAGTVILLVSVAMWVLVSFPKAGAAPDIRTSFAGRLGGWMEPAL
jgi:ferrous iron transport protein B